jgi:hypothetical protein
MHGRWVRLQSALRMKDEQTFNNSVDAGRVMHATNQHDSFDSHRMHRAQFC